MFAYAHLLCSNIRGASRYNKMAADIGYRNSMEF